MTHLAEFRARQIVPLPLAEATGWRLKRYAILSANRKFVEAVASAATRAAISRLPAASDLNDVHGNHGVGFQIIHFAEQVSSVSPVFYWQWGSVLANIDQMRANWATPTKFGNGVSEVVGCVWEMQIVAFETDAWVRTVLGRDAAPADGLSRYLREHFAGCRTGA